MSSRQLVEEAQREFQGPLTGYAAGLLNGDWERARDVVQDTFVKLHQQDPATVRSRLRSWLYTVCRNRSIDVLRKEKPMKTTSGEIFETMVDDWRPDPAAAAERAEQHAAVLRLVDRLPENQREVIRLKFQADLSYREISEITTLSVGNVGFLLHTGLKRLRDMMGKEFGSQ
ncbi:MAG: sigma-70 family RNA polymerase sigma factor [Verrucomicrobiae bacterium]|nr:sigma-70 family RNA polymerase sigma factor [Verrucomicrobiae bacterium]MCP5541800.1 sigma-70 family RNA polymerase sigma factor [Akkermansiaceae bacterium]